MADTDLYLQGYEDAFGNRLNRGEHNLLDIPSHYRMTPERWSFYKNGSRVSLLYNFPSEYTHNKYEHLLSPNQGDTLVMQTSERPRYVVSYELLATWALSMNRRLQGNDRIRWGLWNGTDGWFFEQNSSHAPSQCDLYVEEGGNEILLAENKFLGQSIVEAQVRPALQTSWYRVGPQRWLNSFTENGLMDNHVIANTSLDGRGGPEVGNLPIRYEVRRDAGTSALTMRAGSCSVTVLGRSTPFLRAKEGRIELNIGTAGVWLPKVALRHKSEYNDIVNVQLRNVRITQFGGNSGHALCLFKATDPDRVYKSGDVVLADGDFSTPTFMAATNSCLEIATNVTKAPNDSGTPVASTQNPGGWQAGYGSLSPSGNAPSGGKSANVLAEKRPFYPDDYMVVWVYGDSTGDVDIEYLVEMDY